MTPPDRARWSVNAIFLLHGIISANWLARIPAVQSKLGLSVGILGLYLLCTAFGALCGMPVTARLVNRYGSGAVTTISTLAFCLVLPLPGLVPHGWMLGPALFVFGCTAGSMEISMNTQAVVVEHRIGRPVMTTFHAMFSLGGMTGAAMSGFAAARGIPPSRHLLAIVVPLLAASLFACRSLLEDGPHEPLAAPVHWTRHVRALWVLGAIAFCVLVGEGAMADWTTVYLHGLPGVSPGIAAAGYAVFSVCMAIGRLCGDWFRARFDENTIIRFGSGLACLGLGAGLLMGGLAGGLIGFGCAGLGFSSIFPILTLKSGKVPGVRPQAGIAVVTATGYAGFLVGPPLIGFAAQISTLRIGLGLVPLLSALAVVLAGRMPGDETHIDVGPIHAKLAEAYDQRVED